MSARTLITRRIPDDARAALADAGFEVDIIDRDDAPPRSEVLERIAGTAGVLTMLSDRVDQEFLTAAGEQLRVVANYAVGFDNIDLDAARAANVRITNTPGVLSEATADTAWALILAAARHVIPADRLVRNGAWTGVQPMQFLGLELAHSTIGIVGPGRIGQATARRATGFNMNILYNGPSAKPDFERECGARRVELDELLTDADIVSLNLPYTPSVHHLIGAAQLERMKPTALLINTARGPIVDERALVAALRERTIASAGLDVYEHEPRLSPGLADLENVVLLPHIGSATTHTRGRMARMAADNIVAAIAGKEPPNPVV